MKTLRIYLAALLALTAGACGRTASDAETQRNIVYGIDADAYRLETGEIGKGETLSKILNNYGTRPPARSSSFSTVLTTEE